MALFPSAAAFKAIYLNQVGTRDFSIKFPAVAKEKKAVFSIVSGSIPEGLTGEALERGPRVITGKSARPKTFCGLWTRFKLQKLCRP